MDNEKNVSYYMKKIMEDIEFVLKYTENVSLSEFSSNEVLNSAVSFKFIQISENVKKLPASLQNAYPDIPWFKISGLRNKIVHDYGSIQLEIVYNTARQDLPVLYEELNKIDA